MKYFDEKELEKIPPAQRAEFIKKKLAEIEKTLKTEADDLEKKSKDRLMADKSQLDAILKARMESEAAQRRKEEDDKKRTLEQTVRKDPDADKKVQSVEYGPMKEPVDSHYDRLGETQAAFDGEFEKRNLEDDETIKGGGLYKKNKDYL